MDYIGISMSLSRKIITVYAKTMARKTSYSSAILP